MCFSYLFIFVAFYKLRSLSLYLSLSINKQLNKAWIAAPKILGRRLLAPGIFFASSIERGTIAGIGGGTGAGSGLLTGSVAGFVWDSGVFGTGITKNLSPVVILLATTVPPIKPPCA